MIDVGIFLSLFTMGLISSAHCIGMCGGIMGALTMAIPAQAKAKRGLILVAYNLGRIASYTLMGLLAGFFAEQIAALGGATALRVMAGLLLIAMGLYLADWWRGLTKLETLGRYLWVYIQPLGKGLMPVDTIPKALFLGALWGWLPCGLVYAALATAMTQPAPLMAASAMLAFGLGTLPAVLAAGFAAQQLTRLLQQRQVRMGLALIIIVFGVWTIAGGLGHSHQHQAGHEHHQPVDGDHSTMSHDAVNHEEMNHGDMNHGDMNHHGTNHEAHGHKEMDHSVTEQTAESASARQRTDKNNAIEENQPSSASGSAAKESSSSHLASSKSSGSEHHH